MEYLRATSPTTVVMGPFIYSTDGISAMTAIECSSATIVDIYKLTAKTDITTTAAGTNAMAHVANGYYSLVLTSGNTDTIGPFKVTANAPSALSVWHDYHVIPAVVYDSLLAGSDNLQVDMTQVMGAAVSTSATQIGANVVGFTANAIGADAFAASSISATSLASNAVTNTKFAAGAITASALAANTITSTAFAANSLSATSLSTGTITNAKFAAGAINAAAIAANAISATSLASNAVTNAKFATGAITASALAANTITTTAFGANSITASSLAAGSITNATFASGALTATAIASVALASAKFATDPSVMNVALLSSLAIIQNIHDTDLPAVKVDTASALVWVASAHAQVLVASASAMTNLAYQSGLTTVDTVVDSIKVETASSLAKIDLLQIDMTSALDNISTIDATAIASAVWDEAIAGHVTSGTTAEALNAAGGAGDPWVTALPGSYTGAQAGAMVAAMSVSVASSLVWVASSHGNIASVATVVDNIHDTDLPAVKVDTASALVWVASAHAQVLVASASAMTNLAYGSSLSAVKVDTASSLVWIASAHANIANLDSDIVALDNVVDTVKVDTASALVWIASAHANVDLLQIDMTSSLVNMALLPTAATINAQVLDVLNVDTFAEPGQEAPAATNTLVRKIGYIFKFLRNKIETTSSVTSVYADNGTTVDQKSTIGDDGNVFTRGEFGTGP